MIFFKSFVIILQITKIIVKSKFGVPFALFCESLEFSIRCVHTVYWAQGIYLEREFHQ